MTKLEIIQKIKSLVKTGKSKEALDLLCIETEKSDTNLSNEATLLSARLETLKNDFEIKGTINRNDYEETLSNINLGILALTKKFEGQDNENLEIVKQTPLTNLFEKVKKTFGKTSLIGLIIVVVACTYVIVSISPKFNVEETETVYCGENKTKPVKVFKNPTVVFPSFASEFTNKIGVVKEITDSLALKTKNNASMELNSRVIELREKLNQESIRMELLMKSNFIAFNSRPCDSLVCKDYYRLLEIMVQKNADLEQLKINMMTPVTKGGGKSPVMKIVTDTNVISSNVEKFNLNYNFEK